MAAYSQYFGADRLLSALPFQIMIKKVAVHPSDKNPAMMKQFRSPMFVYHGVMPYDMEKPMMLRITIMDVVELPLMSLKQSTLYDSATQLPVMTAKVRMPRPTARPAQWICLSAPTPQTMRPIHERIAEMPRVQRRCSGSRMPLLRRASQSVMRSAAVPAPETPC